MKHFVRRLFTSPPSAPRVLPTSDFRDPPPGGIREELCERNVNYYPVKLGEVFQARYQALRKLGWGSSATVWLCRDLVGHKYVALKVCASNYRFVARELHAANRFQSLNARSPYVQRYHDTFQINISTATHQCFVLEPLSVNLSVVDLLFDDQLWELPYLVRTAREMLQALEFVHTKAKLIHCDLRKDNFLMRPPNDAAFEQMEAQELSQSSARVIDGDRVVYETRDPLVPLALQHAVLCDFGEARPGDSLCTDDIQPMEYRAPEVLLGAPISYATDIWNFGVLIWHVFEKDGLFDPSNPPKGLGENKLHMAQMVALMGLPSRAFLDGHSRIVDVDDPKRPVIRRFFTEDGQWALSKTIPIPEMTLESMEKRLEGQEKTEFLRFIRRCLRWDPAERATAAELRQDPFLRPRA